MPKRVRIANKASAHELAASVSSIHVLKDLTYRITVATPSDLQEEERASVWAIFEQNMRPIYVTSSFGWDPPSKRRELFDPLSRFLLLSRGDDEEDTTGGKSGENSVLAYAMFRFEREEKENVIYCYELQVSTQVWRYGFGRILMQQLDNIGAQWGMQKVMLTVFKANSDALKFYHSLNYTTDPTSPGYVEDDGEWVDEDDTCDYEILSKIIAPRDI